MIVIVKNSDKKYFPIRIGNKEIALVEDEDGNKVIGQQALEWPEFDELLESSGLTEKKEVFKNIKKQDKFKYKKKKDI